MYQDMAVVSALARDATKDVVGTGADEVRTELREDAYGGLAYFIDIVIPAGRSSVEIARLRNHIGRRVRDDLLERLDETYPFVQVLSCAEADSSIV